jgi:hypothetical protein
MDVWRSLGRNGGRDSYVIWFGKIFGLDSSFPEKFIFIRTVIVEANCK